MPQLYTLDGSIAEFFETHSSTSREDCDVIAKSLAGNTFSAIGPVVPVPIQGSWSYTVTVTVTVGEALQTKIVQFRARESILDMQILERAHEIHGEWVPAMEFHGQTPQTNTLTATPTATATAKGERKGKLSIYTTDKVPGVPFFAQSWKSNSSSILSSKTGQVQVQVDEDEIKQRMLQKLNLLHAGLPTRFTPTLDRLIREHLPLLFRPDYPVVLTHGDLCGLNVMVDPDSLHITGFIDWAEAEVLPFGTALYGILNVLGVMDGTGWHYQAEYQNMIHQFWTTFEMEIGQPLSDVNRNSIRAACTIGIFLQNGFSWSSSDQDGLGWSPKPAIDGDDAIKYLDAWVGVDSLPNDLLLSL